jgi:hypothetical protein
MVVDFWCGTTAVWQSCTWSTEKQTNVAFSTSEAEYIAITSGFKEAKYFINLIQVEMKLRVTPIRSRVDNIGAGYMAVHSVTNKRTKHIDLRYHYVREQISEFKNFEMEYVATKATETSSPNHLTEDSLKSIEIP